MIRRGDTFNTDDEKGCQALTEPNTYGNFLALDSNGVERTFNTFAVRWCDDE